jgi:ABC-type lipoprotein export system ATPase subunit
VTGRPARVVLEHIALTETGPTVALSLFAGQSLAVVGRSGSGKSWLLSVIEGSETPARGSASRDGRFESATPTGTSRRLKPQALATSSRYRVGDSDRVTHERATEALVATGLWEVRRESVADLSPIQRSAAALLPALAGAAEVLVFDGTLDELDPWALSGVLDLLKKRQSHGACWVVATNRPEVAAIADAVIALKDRDVRFAGSPAELIRSVVPSRLEVATDNMPGVKAITRPFEVQVRESNGSLRMEAAEGQTLAARLLLEGYGDVRFVVLREPTFAEALLALA